MKRALSISCLWICLLVLSSSVIMGQDNHLDITPTPQSLVQKNGHFTLNSKTSFAIGKNQRADLKKVAAYFQSKILYSTGYNLNIKNSGSSNAISLQIDKSLKIGNEGYQLTVTPKKVIVKAKTPQGIFYGMQSVMQLLPPQIESETIIDNVAWEIPCVEIKDEPAYGYRGMMLDVCRHFHDVEFVKKQLDIMAMFKMNYFHWHLTDDHLWTIEIKKYPRLAEVGSVRRNADGSIHRGFYTQEQIKEVVAYAAERYITVIPEVELPGHALAALTAYPEYSCTGGPFELRNKWGVEDNVYCAGNDKTFEFLQDILEEVIPLFPGKFFHIGGDECPKVRWNECPKCQKRIKNENLKDAHELQSYFIHRIEKIILAHGKSMIGWDEILEGGLAPSATVMSWRGEEGGIAAASMGHDVIMTPSKWMYIDHGQGAVETEPIAIRFGLPLEKTYSYDPKSPKIPENLRHHVLGAQCNMWTEYAVTPEYTEYLLYPRMLAKSDFVHDYPEDLYWEEIEAPTEDLKGTEKYYSFHLPAEVNRVKGLTAIILKDAPDEKDLPQMERREGQDWIGLRIRHKGKITDLYINQLADGRLMHSNSWIMPDGWMTDAYMFAVSYPEGTEAKDAKDFFIAYGSALRRDNETYFSSLAKLFVIQKAEDKKLNLWIDGQPKINTTFRSTKKPVSVEVNDKKIPVVYQKSQVKVKL